jgi:hypothetical protein
MLTLVLGWASADGVDWSRLFHAYGVATDTPGHLRALTGDDPELQAAAADHLDGAVLHQGSVYPVTPVAVRVVAGSLGEPALRRPEPGGDALLVYVLTFLRQAAESAATTPVDGVPPPDAADLAAFYGQLAAEDLDAWASPVAGALFDRSVADLRETAPEVVDAVLPFVADPDLAVRTAAVGALAWLGVSPPARPRVPELADRLGARLRAVDGRDERANLVLALGRLGADTSPWLDDADPAVRACSALGLRDDARATAVLVDALTRPGEADTWFGHGMPLIRGHVRFCLLREVLAREVPFADLLPAALAVVEVASGYTADADWGPLLLAAFPGVPFTAGVRPPPPARLDDAQRALLRALVANDTLWEPRNGNADLARMRVGLPDSRDAVAELAR